MREDTIGDLEDGFCVEAGRNIEVDLEKLVLEVVIAPDSGVWFEQLVRRVLDKFGLTHVSVRTSSIDRAPTDT